jgi:RND family efflux transporter MFP subunit
MKPRVTVLLLVCSAAVVVSCSKRDTPKAGPTVEKPRTVNVAKVEWRKMERVVTVTGSFLAREEATLSVKVPGRLRTIAVDLGSVVKAGDVIAQVEPADYEIRVQQAEAAVEQARAGLGLPLQGTNDLIEVEDTSPVRQAKALLDEATKNRDRVRNLSDAGVVSPSELDTVEAGYKVALNRFQTAIEDSRTKVATLGQRRAELAFAQKQLADTSIRAPFDGAVQKREAGLGEYVASGTPVVILVRSDPLRLRLEVPEREAAEVRTGQPVRLHVEGHTNLWVGRIDRLSPALNEENRMLVVESDIPNDGALRPGLFVRANIIVTDRDRGLAVPSTAVIAFAGLEKVVLANDGKAEERTVTTHRTGPGWTEITTGLKEGEVVVLEPGGLRTGQSIVIAREVTVNPKAGPEFSGP